MAGNVRSPIGQKARLYALREDTITDLHGLGTYADPDNPTEGELQARDDLIIGNVLWTAATLTCPVDVDSSGSTETADDSDRCNPDSTVVVKSTNEISFNFRKRKDDAGALPQWVKDIKRCWVRQELLTLMMLDAPKSEPGADGFFMLGAVTEYSESQPLTDAIEISATVVPGSTPVDGNGQPYMNWDVITKSTT